MGYFDSDMMEMLDTYLLETSQLLEQADTILMGAEQEMALSREDINGIFRAMHTIKSSSAMMGLTGLSSLAHRLEDVFDVFRDDPSRLRGFEQETFDLIFAASDFIRSEMGRMQQEDFRPADASVFDDRIEALVARVKAQRQTVVRLRFEAGCKMENIRAFMVVRQIKGMCGEMETYPKNVDTNPEAEDYIRQSGFYIRFVSEDPKLVLKKLQEALFVESMAIVDDMPREQEEKEQAVVSTGSEYIHVRVEKLDELQNLTGELMIAAQAAGMHDGRQSGLKEDQQNRQLERLLKELEELVISIRMVPFSSVAPKLHRIVRDMCRKEKKEVTFVVEGQDVELDKKIADSILEPLVHLIRNAIDHGIELPKERLAAGKPQTGHVRLSLSNTGGEIVVAISDDGCGIDTDAVLEKAKRKNLLTNDAADYTHQELLELCLLPGFSTREAANEYSGRGVGLDVVRQMVEKFGGHLHLNSVRGEGSRFILHLPLTLTIVDCVRIQVGNHYFAVPAHQVVQFSPYRDANLVHQDGREYWIHEGRYIPVISMRQFYDIREARTVETQIMVYVTGSTREACLLTDKISDSGSLVEKPLPKILGSSFRHYTGISGCSLLADGSICMQLDIEDLIRMAGGVKAYG